MVSKFKFVRYAHIKKKISALLALVLFGQPSEVGNLPLSNSKILKLTDFQALDPNFVLALELKVLKLEGSSYGIRPSIYVLRG